MLRITGLLLCLALAACSTPPEVKQALAAKDQAYTENEQLMRQYRELVSNITTRHLQWYRYVQTRLKLDLALQWATTNPRQAEVPDAALAEDDAALLGSEVMTVINTIRLKSLPERKGQNGQPVFAAGSGDMTNLVQHIIDPALSAATGEPPAKATQRDPLGLFYRESRFESADRFERELKDLQAEEEDAKKFGRSFPDANKLRKMEGAQTTLRTLYRDRAKARDEAHRQHINQQIRDLTSKFTPAPGGLP
jgi:hypothetical protein